MTKEIMQTDWYFSTPVYSIMKTEWLKPAIKATDKKRWLVVGIEAHICVYQTVLALLNEGFEVDVVSDCISSRLKSNIALALVNMRESGASITSLEMCVFELVKKAKTDNFREILSVIK